MEHVTKYRRWYDRLTTRGQLLRELNCNTEIHHILPECVGGKNTKENKTTLTAREHFICHWLLTKIYTTGKDRYRILNALQGMRRENKFQTRYHTKITSRVYANLKAEWSTLSSERVKGNKNPMFGKNHTLEAKAKISEANTGINNGAKRPEIRKLLAEQKLGKARAEFTEEWKENLSKNHKSKQPDFDGAIKEETKKKIGDKIRGRKQTQEEKDRRGASVKALGLKREKLLCPHCNKEVAVNGYARWHGDNCKMNKDTNNDN